MKCEKLQFTWLAVALLAAGLALATTKCDANLLSTMKLRGLKYSVRDQMRVCPMVYEKCCSLTDEIRIVQLWNIYARPNLNMFTTKIIRVMEQLLRLEPFYQRLRENELVVNYVVYSRLAYIHKTCSLTARAPRLSLRQRLREVAQMIPGSGAVERVQGNPVDAFLADVISNMWLYDLRQQGRFRFQFPIRLIVITRFRSLRQARRKLLDKVFRPVEQFEKAQNELREELRGRAPRNTFISDETAAGKGVKRVGRALKATRGKRGGVRLDASAELAQQGDGRFQLMKPPVAEAPTRAARRAAAVGHRDLQKATREAGRPNKVVSSVYRLNTKEHPYLRGLDKRARIKPIFLPPDPSQPEICCQSTLKYFMKPLIFVNEHKFGYCRSVLRDVGRSRVTELVNSLGMMKASLMSLLELKKTLYCSVCDAHHHKFIDFDRGVMVFSQDFCLDLLTTYRDYLIFKNVILVEYIDLLQQAKGCLKSDGAELDFPFLSRVSWHKRRVPFIHRCFENLDAEDFYRYCRFMCMQYKIKEFSNFFEGDLNFLANLNADLVSFLRQRFVNNREMMAALSRLRITQGLRAATPARNSTVTAAPPRPANATARVRPRRPRATETPDIGLFDPDKEEQQDFRKPPKSNFDADASFSGYSENFLKHEIFEKIPRPYAIEGLRPFFSASKKALNPLQIINLVNFNYNVTDLLVAQSKQTKNEPLTRDVVKTYFTFGINGLPTFNHDADLKIDNLYHSDYYIGDNFLPYDNENVTPLPRQDLSGEPLPPNKDGPTDWIRHYVNNKNATDPVDQAIDDTFHKK